MLRNLRQRSVPTSTSKRHLLNGGAAAKIGWAVARIIGSAGAFVLAAMFARLVDYLQFAFFDLVMPPWETSSGSEPASHFAISPLFLYDRLDVVCAVFIPTIIVLWSRKGAAPIRRIRALADWRFGLVHSDNYSDHHLAVRFRFVGREARNRRRRAVRHHRAFYLCNTTRAEDRF